MLDLNSDLGEGEPASRTRALMQVVTSANVACAGHAGNARIMEMCVRLAVEHAVRLGAHPGMPGRFGRGQVRITPEELESLILHQVSALVTVAAAYKRRVIHVKLHGSLYHATEASGELAGTYVDCIRRWFPGMRILAMAGGRVVQVARDAGVPVWAEGFADRGYRADGSLVPRGEPGALLERPGDVRLRIREAGAGLGVAAISGERVGIEPQSWCVHADTPGSLKLARAAAAALRLGPS